MRRRLSSERSFSEELTQQEQEARVIRENQKLVIYIFIAVVSIILKLHVYEHV